MKKSTMFGLALTALLAASSSLTASAQSRYGDHSGRYGNGSAYGNGYDRSGWHQGMQSDFTGTWRLEGRRGEVQGGWGRQTWGDNRQAGGLPDLIQIERGGRQLRIENSNGRLLRQVGRGDWNDNSIQVVSGGPRGQRVLEVFTLRARGRELVVHTTVTDRRGTREFTSVYERA